MSSDSKLTFGPYSLYEKLGSHRRHHVYRAVHDPTGNTFACKLINISSKVDLQTAIQKVQLEARILQRLEHPNIVKIVDAGVRDGKMFIIMDQIEGESLAAILSRRGTLPWDLATEYARHVAEGLDYIHKQEMVHLKLNPDKILISADGTLRIVDLRLNRAKKRRWDDAKHRVLDVAAYMAPEQLTNQGGTHKSDIYTVGILLYEMITGSLPFEPDTLSSLLQAKQTAQLAKVSSKVIDCPTWLDDLIMQMVAPQPASRPHSMHAVVAALREVEKLRSNSASMTEHLTRGFNPLTAGRDKTEARRMLGKTAVDFDSPNQPTSRIPRVLGIIGIAIGLLFSVSLMAGGLYISLRPPSEEKLYQRAVVQLNKEESEQTLLAAKRNLEPLIELYPDGTHAEKARQMMEEVIANLAERRMKRRDRFGRNPKNEVEAQCRTASELLDLGDKQKALEIYEQAWTDEQGSTEIPIPENYSFEADSSEVIQFRILAKLRANQIKTELAEANGGVEDSPEELDETTLDAEQTLQVRRLNIQEKIAQAQRLEIEGNLVESRRIMRALLNGFGEDQDVADLLEPIRETMSANSNDSTNSNEATNSNGSTNSKDDANSNDAANPRDGANNADEQSGEDA